VRRARASAARRAASFSSTLSESEVTDLR
jgi:hypothetical protein